MKISAWALMSSLLITTLCEAKQEDPVVMRIANEDIYKSEFEYIYNKNNSVSTSDKKSIDEYVDLFINYKLKVAEAKSLGFMGQPSYMSEYQKYENQLIAPYVREKETEKELIHEAFERKKRSVLTSHILVKIENWSDTLTPYLKINDIYKKLKEGADFSELAQKYSDCPSSKRGGSLGYVNVFDMVYEFENVVYSTPIGTYSKPFRTEFGYHIVKTFADKVNPKDWRFSHILIAGEMDKNMQSLTDSLMGLIKKGESYESLAKRYSYDKKSAPKGGDLGYLSEGSFPEQIISQVKSMEKVGDVSLCMTAFGVHILKLTELVPFVDEDEFYKENKSRFNRGGRDKQIGEAFFTKLRNKYNVNVYEENLDVFDSIMNTKDERDRVKFFHNVDAPLYTFNGNVYSQEAFLSYFRKALSNYEYSINHNKINLANLKKDQTPKNEFVKKTFNEYLNNVMFEVEKESIKKENVDLRNLLKEYSDGLLLFEISNEYVWEKAASDTSGLRKYYEANSSKYKWELPHYRGIIVYCKKEEDYKKIEDILKSNTEERAEEIIKNQFNISKKGDVRIEKGLYSQGVKDALDDKVFHIIKYSDKTYPYVAVRGKILKAPQIYQDVKGPVTADYQNYLEGEWVKTLRSKYTYKVYGDVIKKIK